MSPRSVAGVRSEHTSTPVHRSQGELSRILTRYGCSRFGHDTDYEGRVVAVWFTVPEARAGGTEPIPVRLEVRLDEVGRKLARGRKSPPPVEQVERVAWRHIVLLVEAGLLAAESGVKRVSEFFLADTLVEGASGQRVRLVEALEGHTPGWRKLLASGGQ